MNNQYPQASAPPGVQVIVVDANGHSVVRSSGGCCDSCAYTTFCCGYPLRNGSIFINSFGILYFIVFSFIQLFQLSVVDAVPGFILAILYMIGLHATYVRNPGLTKGIGITFLVFAILATIYTVIIGIALITWVNLSQVSPVFQILVERLILSLVLAVIGTFLLYYSFTTMNSYGKELMDTINSALIVQSVLPTVVAKNSVMQQQQQPPPYA
ncbi:hypothetical protein MP638_005427 [Amoeboaphelidium occidentale]|nr:hypothetical protein MP638_005427 [Amoeboaphelidium occidentale]